MASRGAPHWGIFGGAAESSRGLGFGATVDYDDTRKIACAGVGSSVLSPGLLYGWTWADGN